MNHPPEDLETANQFRDTLVPRADGHVAGVFPFWCGWAIMEAYLAGLKEGREQEQEKHERRDGDE